MKKGFFLKEKAMRFFLRIFWLFPIKNDQVVLNSYNGRLFSCNPKYLALGLLKTGRFKVYYALRKDSRASLPAGIERIDYRSLRHFCLLMTSRYIVVNSTGFSGLLPYRKDQVLINTWHGAGLFKTSGDVFFKSAKSRYTRSLFAANTSFFLSSSEAYSKKQSRSMLVGLEKFIPSGAPRNDVFFEAHPEIVQRVKAAYSVKESDKIILYAPTYRDGPVTSMRDYDFPLLDVDRVLEACRARFGGEFVFLFRAHHDMVPENLSEACINASTYPDIQELLYAADVLITDYSSLQWDFALQRKPGFLYTPDLEQYDAVHPFASDYREWPFETARSSDGLAALIAGYDADRGRRRIDDYFERLGSYEKGKAVENTLRVAFGVES